MHTPLRIFFYLLYHPLAALYDLVAALVSFGKWRQWVLSVIPYVEGERLLELGHGPGHLQKALHERGYYAFGLDLSRQMGQLAKRKLGNSHRLVRGKAQALPFPNEAFSCIVATFPSEYILERSTLEEARRVLKAEGKILVIPGIRFRATGWLWKLLRRIWKVTEQDTLPPLPALEGLQWEERTIPEQHVDVILWIGHKR
ncbi:MAG: class I SAM-dependent methyltransferase [Anaerolineales bacterium]